MDFVHYLIHADKWLFECVNIGMGNAFFDALLPLLREKWFWAPFYLFVIAFSLMNFGSRGGMIVLGLVVAVGLTDFSGNNLIKKKFQRVRPCNDVEMAAYIQPRVSCGSGYSFTSNHAANHFAAAIFLIGAFGLAGRWQQKALLAWASLIAFSQVYVGVHYPLDVVCGGLYGCLIGWMVLLAWRKLFPVSMGLNRLYP